MLTKDQTRIAINNTIYGVFKNSTTISMIILIKSQNKIATYSLTTIHRHFCSCKIAS